MQTPCPEIIDYPLITSHHRFLSQLATIIHPSSSRCRDRVGFSIEAFALPVPILIADYRVVTERLIWFEQAHDLLKRNVDVRRNSRWIVMSCRRREPYRRRVHMLEEQPAHSDVVNASLHLFKRIIDVCFIQEQLEELAAEKLAVEERAAEKAETLRKLTEANVKLSSRADNF